MKKSVFVILFVVGAVVASLLLTQNKEESVSQKSATQTETSEVLGQKSSDSSLIFIPYWTFGSDTLETQEFDELLYFGIAADENGVDREDPGFEKLQDFMNVSNPEKKRFLTVRMLDHDSNAEVLRDSGKQSRIIRESLEIADEYGFDGIVLDLETASISFETVVERINAFNASYYKAAKAENKLFYIAVYGDTYYRARPYEIKTLSKTADKILIMSYDFHKARGNPGPNFPLNGKEEYGYDFKTMISDFSKEAGVGKIVLVFGLFGYDWEVDSSGSSTAQGQADSANVIKSNFIDSCTQKSCKWERDIKSGETRVTYIDEEDTHHVIWFEDMESVKAKQQFLKQQGINSYGYWAYSYF